MGDRYRHRRPRYYDDESDTSEVDNYPPPKPRRRDDRGGSARPPPPPQAMPSDIPPPPAPMPQQVRRPSILVDPDETPSERAHRRRSRSNSNVRLQTSDDEDDYRQQRRRAVPRESSRRHDLEAKNGEDHHRFRQKRDGYESDEGEVHRRARQAPREKAQPYPDDDYGRTQERSLPMRGKPRDPIDNGVEYGGAAVPADAGAIRRRRT